MSTMIRAIPDCTELIGRLSFLLTRSGRRMASAESCTGGLIAAACTGVAGSSDWFNGGVVAYANAVKIHLLRVPEDMLARHGAVSEAVVRRMALGALSACNAQAAVAVSGIAGPSGGTKEKPVGTVWIAAAVADGREVVQRAACRRFSGDRAAVRAAAACTALEDLVGLLEGR